MTSEEKSPKEETVEIDDVLDLESFKKKKDELAVFLNNGFKFKSAKGKRIEVPALSGIPEKEALMTVIDFLTTNPTLIMGLFSSLSGGKKTSKRGKKKLDSPSISFSSILKVLLDPKSTDKAFKCLQKVSSILLHKKESWVNENLLLGDMVKVVRPFFAVEGGLINQQSIESLPGN